VRDGRRAGAGRRPRLPAPRRGNASSLSATVYTEEDRERLRASLIAAAQADTRITGAAVTGSAARDAQDRWSDLDLAFGIGDPAQLPAALSDWTDLMYREHEAQHHVDVVAGSSIYRVFLLSNTLQVDLAFSPAAEFGAIAPTFRLLFGSAVQRQHVQPPTAAYLIGFGWLYALHARSCIERGKKWQAEYMISGVRDHALALACLRHDLPAVQGRGLDRLPQEVSSPFESALVRSLDTEELRRAFTVAIEGLLRETRHSDPDLAERLEGPLTQLTSRSS
jgi:predicted nucleotidyltransferase